MTCDPIGASGRIWGSRCLFGVLLLWLPLLAAGDSDEVGLLELVNYYEYSPQLLSSGQPEREQFAAIRAAGVAAIINLAPVTAPAAIAEEGEIVRGLGMDYVHIPVNWEEPSLDDVTMFLNAMKSFAGKRVLVHCYANARASAFVYLYRVLAAGHNRAEAHATMRSIWDLNPGYEFDVVPQWQALVRSAEARL